MYVTGYPGYRQSCIDINCVERIVKGIGLCPACYASKRSTVGRAATNIIVGNGKTRSVIDIDYFDGIVGHGGCWYKGSRFIKTVSGDGPGS